MAIHVNQSLLTIKLDTVFDISAATSLKILYKKPDETTGEWIGYLSGTTLVAYDVLDGDLDQAGTWQLQSYVVVGGDKGYGEVVYWTIDENLD